MERIHNAKNAGYAGADNEDALANFRMSERLGISAFMGCLVRITDKFIRITNLARKLSNEQVGESIKDTLIDLANYCLIAICLYEEEETARDKEGARMELVGLPVTCEADT